MSFKINLSNIIRTNLKISNAKEDNKEDEAGKQDTNTIDENKANSVTMKSSAYVEAMEKFEGFINDSFKIGLCIQGYNSKEIDADIALLRQKDTESLTEEEKDYQETLKIAAGNQREFTTNLDIITQRMDTYTKFIKHVIKSKYPEMSDSQVDNFINEAKSTVISDLQSGNLPVTKFDEGYRTRDILKIFLGLSITNAFSEYATDIIRKAGSASV